MSAVQIVRRAADVLQQYPAACGVVPAIATPLADLLDEVADFAMQPGVAGPQKPLLDVCRAILATVDGGAS